MFEPVEFEVGETYGFMEEFSKSETGFKLHLFPRDAFEELPEEIKEEHRRFHPLAKSACDRAYAQFEKSHSSDEKREFESKTEKEALEQLQLSANVISNVSFIREANTVFNSSPAKSIEFSLDAKDDESLLQSFEHILLHCMALPFKGVFFDCAYKSHFTLLIGLDKPYYRIVARFRIKKGV